MSEFVHLHVHSEFSLLDGAARIEELTETAAQMGMSALALTDHGVMYGAIPFYKACKKRGIKPIIGCEVYFTSGSIKDKQDRREQPIYHLLLLAQNQEGYRNLMKLNSEAHLRGFHYKPRIDLDLLKQHAAGLICTSSCLAGEVSQHLLHDQYAEAKAAAERYRAIFGDRFYLEIQDHGIYEQKKVIGLMIELSEETGIPLVATNDAHYIRTGDAEVQDILLCIGTGKTVDDENRLKFSSDQLYLKSEEEMYRLFAQAPEALKNTVHIAENCNLELQFGDSILPAFQEVPEGQTAQTYLRRLCLSGLDERYGQSRDSEYGQTLQERLDYELQVIEDMGYSDYFLIVWDFIRFAHSRGIVTGPGRGSAAGSLVSYVLKITDVDPIHYGLLFERFLNPERVSMPDIDIDFSDLRRDEVIEYVVRKYGSDHVAQIATFGTMAAKAAVRDVGRVLDLPYQEVDRAAKMIPNQLGVTIERALEQSEDLRERCRSHPETARLIQMAMKVEGMPRHVSTHAAGVVISRDLLTDHVPLQEGAAGTPLTQYPMDVLESIGLLKMDFLGLRNLSIIERATKWIEEQEGITLDFHQIGFADEATYALLSRGDTNGIFQLESSGVKRVLKEMKPTEFEDIVSVVALYRPGPMEFIPKYIECKHGRQPVEYPHPVLEPILADTYGIIVYQEQIMQIASAMAGFRLGEADLLRRAVSKKKREVLDQERSHFVQGSLAQGHSEQEANHVYDMIVRFADYGFPKAHATAYAVLAYQCAYLKARYPVQFMSAMLTSVMGNHRKVAEYVENCRHMGIPVLPPDINESGVDFTPIPHAAGHEADAERAAEPFAGSDSAETRPATESLSARSVSTAAASRHDASSQGAIRFGLAAIKNVGTQAIMEIMQKREQGAFRDLLDVCRRVDLRVCNKRVIESLIQGGAADSLPGHRAQLVAVLDDNVEAALKWKQEREDLQLHLFGLEENVEWEMKYPDIRSYTMMQQLELERELLGLFISGHPLDSVDEDIRQLPLDRIADLQEAPDHSGTIVCGMVTACKIISTKKGQPMAFLEIEDRIESLEVVVFPKVWQENAGYAGKGNILLAAGKVQQQDESVKLLADELLPLSQDQAESFTRRWRQSYSLPQRRGGAAGKNGPAAVRTEGKNAMSSDSRSTSGRTGQTGMPVSRKDSNTAAHRAASQTAAAGPDVSSAAGVRSNSAKKGQRQDRLHRSGNQKVYIKIAKDREQTQLLVRLKEMLKQHPGSLSVLLFYERSGKTMVLNKEYNIKPSPELFRQMESILGEDRVVVK